MSLNRSEHTCTHIFPLHIHTQLGHRERERERDIEQQHKSMGKLKRWGDLYL